MPDELNVTMEDESPVIEVQVIGTGPVGPPGGPGPVGPTGPEGPAGNDGVSPEVTITAIPDGHRVTITDAEHPTGQSFDVMDGIATDEQVEAAVDDYLEDHPTVGGTFSNAAKRALLALLEKVAYVDQNGQTYLDTLEQELFAIAVSSITAVYTQSGTVYDTDSLDTLKQYLTVTATYADSSTETVTTYALSGTLTEGTSTITVTYGGKTDTFTVTVSVGLDSIVYGTMTYRDLFVTGNLFGWFGDFEDDFVISHDWTLDQTNKGGYRVHTNSPADPSVSTAVYNSPTHSVNVSATGSSDYINAFANLSNASEVTYIIGAAFNVPQITAGKVEFQAFGVSSTVHRVNTTEATDGWVPMMMVGAMTPNVGWDNNKIIEINFGALSTPTCTAYIDDIVVTPLPSGMTSAQAETAFAKYIEIVGRAG